MPRLFADVSQSFIRYARLDVSATEQSALKEWGLVDDAVAVLVTTGKEIAVERVSKLRDSLTTTLVPLLADWQAAWKKAVEASDGLPTESEEKYMNLLTHVMMVKDSRLELEVRFLRCAGAFDHANRMFRQRWVPDAQSEADVDARALASDGMTKLYSSLCLRLRDLKAMRENGVAHLFPQAATSLLDIVINSPLDANAFCDAAVSSGEELVQAVRAEWSGQLDALTQSLSSWCPSWEVEAGGADFPTTEHLKALLTNKHYKELTPVANILDGMLKASSLLMRAGVSPIYTPQAVKAATSARDLGYTTTSLTICCFKAYVELPKITAGTKRAAEVATLCKARLLDTTHDKAPQIYDVVLLHACLCLHTQALSEKGFNVEHYKNISLKLASLEK